MSYLVFARKYRPQSFAEVAGQEAVITTLKNAILHGRIAHAFLFAGPRGVGKTTTARLLAKALNCEKGPTAEPCGTCSSCLETAEGHSIDVLEIDGASNRGIDDVKALRESIQYTPARDRHKVVIIDEVHMLSTPAFNALLKTLEEPPAHAKFIFATTEIHKVPATILSRCQVYDFRRIPFSETLDRLREIVTREGVKASDQALSLIARHADGCLRDAQSALDQAVAFAGDELNEEVVRGVLGLVGSDVLFEIVDALLAERSADLLLAVERLVDSGTDLRQLNARLSEHVRNLLVLRVAPGAPGLVAASDSDLERLRTQSQQLRDDEALRALHLLAQADEELKWTSAPRFTLERTLLQLIQARRLTPLGELVAALAGGSPPSPVTTASGAASAAPSAPPSPSPGAAPPGAPLPRQGEAKAAALRPSPAARSAGAASALPSRSAPGSPGRSAPPSDMTLTRARPEPPRAVEAQGSAEEASPARREARERASHDPEVLRTLDLFKAELVDVDEPD